jgi:hypothetical protein
MDSVTAGEVRARSLADCEEHWNALGRPLTKAEKRWREHEREWRTSLATDGLLPADSLVADIRSGAKERRDKRSMRNLLRDRAKLAKWKVAPARVHAPERLEIAAPATRKRERRATTRRSALPRGSPDDPHELAVIPPSAFRAELQHALGERA